MRMMKFNAPTQITVLVSLAIAVLAILSRFVSIPNVSANAFWIAVIAWVVLMIGCVFRRR